MKCRIFRDFDSDKIVSVKNEQGDDSSLYREALSYTKNEEQALNIWAVSSLDSFKAFRPGTMEPSLEEVMKFINNMNTLEQLGVEDVIELSNNLQSVNEETPDSLLSKLQKTFFNGGGVFEVVRKKMRDSGLYTDSEINNLMSFPSIRAQVKQFINKLRNTLREDNNLQDLFVDNPVDTEFQIQDTSQSVGLGKFQNYLPEDVRDYLIKSIRNYSTDTELMSKIQGLDNADIRDHILNDPQALAKVKEMVKNSQIIPIFMEMNGNLIPKMNNDLVPTLMSSMRVGEPTESFTEALDVIRNIPSQVWYSNEEIPGILRIVELEAARYQIDIAGLSDTFQEKSQEEVIGLLDVIDDFLFASEQDVISNTEIYELGEDIAEYFGREFTQEEAIIPSLEEDKGKNLTMLNTSMTELEAFEAGGYVKQRDTVYQKAVIYESFSEMVNETYDSLLKDITILPDSVLERLNLKTDKGYNFSYLLNERNAEKIKRGIFELSSRDADASIGFAVVDNDSFDLARQLTLYKHLLGSPLQTPNPKTLEGFTNRKKYVAQAEELTDYLTSDFISEFYTEVLNQKIFDTPLYNAALKYFEITDRGITFNTENPMIKAQVVNLLDTFPMAPMLKLHSALVKDTSMEFLIPDSLGESTVDIQDRRDYAVNNPESLDTYSKPVTRVDLNTIVVKNGREEFLKLKDGIYELTDSNRGVGVYSKLANVMDNTYNVFNISQPVISPEISASMFEATQKEVKLVSRTNVSKTELKQLEAERTCQ